MSQPIPISKTKIVVPNRRPEILSRPRLLEGLDSWLDNRLIIVSAPAGYGKTSLLIDLANHVKIPVCWLSLDLLDRDPQRFMAYLIASLAERFPEIGGVSLAQLKQLKSIEKDAEALLVTLTNEIYDQIEEDFLLVLDDYHLLDDVPVISSLLNRFLELVVENCHVILSSRTLPSLENVTLMVAREQVAGLSHIELKFLPREVQALYAQNYHKHLSDEDAQEFVEQTSGWITGMVLSNLPGLPRISGVGTFSYLGQQVLDQQPDYIREFLMRTSLPEEFNAEFCEIILSPLHSDSPGWYDLMGFILDKNLFVLPLDNDGRWLRYHPLFREFLQTRLKEERPHEIRPILERMVSAYEKAGEWEKAYFTCKQLEDVEALADVVERASTPMLLGAFVTLEGWVNSLPPAMVQTRPGLISLRGPILAAKGNLSESKELLDKAIEMYRDGRDTNGLILALIRRANTLRFLGDYTASLADVQEALSLTGSDTSPQIYYAEALRIKGLDLYRMGESRQAVEALEHSLSLFSAMNEPGRISILLMETGMVHGAIGDVESARHSYQRALKLKQAENDVYTQAEILNNLAVLYHQTGEYELASEAFETGLASAKKSRNRRAEALILAGLGDLYTEVGEFDAALQAYQHAELATENIPGLFVTNYIVVAKGILALTRGDFDDVANLLKTFRRKFKTSQSSYERGLWGLLEGRYSLFKEEYDKAIVSLKESRGFFSKDGRNVELQQSMVWLMAAYEQAGERDHARTIFREFSSANINPNHAILVALCQTSSWLHGLQNDKLIGRQLGSWIEKSRRLNSKLPAIRRILRRHASLVQIPSATLSIHAFGNPEVSMMGTVLQMSDWRTQSVRDLFFYFLYKQEAVTKEQVGIALWPEMRDPQSLKARFKNEIYRLRRAAGRDVIVFDDEYYRFNSQMDYEYDVEGFDSHLQRARITSDMNARKEHLQKAVDLVHGPYLVDVDAEWAVDERERLRQAYSIALEELAALYLNMNQLAHCLKLCKQAINEDRYHEMIYQIEMRAYSAMGDRPAIARCYRACQESMRDLGIPVSEETEKLYRELTG